MAELVQNHVRLQPLPVWRKKLLPCSNVCLYAKGKGFFLAEKMYLVSQKDLLTSLWPRSANELGVVSGDEPLSVGDSE